MKLTRLQVMAFSVAAMSTAAFGQAQKPTLVPAPVELQPNPALTKFEDPLRAAFMDTLRDKAGVLVPMRKEVEAAFAEGKRQDCRESNECLTQLAVRAGTLYALFVEVTYTQKKELVVSGRVVRDDGKLIGSSTAREEKGAETIIDVSRRLFIKLFEQLDLAKLPTFKDAAAVAPENPIKDPEVKDPPPPLPPLVPEDTGAGQRAAGKTLLIGGLSVAALGGVLAGVGCGIGCGVQPTTPGNSVPEGELGKATTARALLTAGFVGAGVGAVAAAVGAVVWGTAAPAPVNHVTFIPTAGGGVMQFGGCF